MSNDSKGALARLFARDSSADGGCCQVSIVADDEPAAEQDRTSAGAVGQQVDGGATARRTTDVR
jgi:hypothetical protein